MYEERKENMKAALRKYSFKLLQLREEQEIKNNNPIRQDLLEYVNQIHIILENLDEPDIQGTSIRDNKELSRAAVSYFISELETSAQNISNIVNKNQMSKLNEEIAFGKNLVDRIGSY